MPTTTNLTTSYVGEAALEYIHKCFLASATINQPAITVKEDVRKSWKIRRIATSVPFLAAETCDFTPIGTVDLDERSLDVYPIEANLQMCTTDFLGDWGSIRMGSGANNKSLPPETSEAMIQEILGAIGQDIERMIWEADSGGTDPFDGLTAQILAGSPSEVVGAVITDQNVLAKMALVYEAWSALNCFGAPDQLMYVSKNVAASFQAALGAVNSDQGYLTQSVIGEKPYNYLGVPIFVAPGLRASTMILTKQSNLFVGTDSLSDQNEVTLKDMREVDLSNNVRFRGGFHLGVNYGWDTEIVICEPTIT